MNEWMTILLPAFLVMSRVTAFVMVAPLLSWKQAPARVRLGWGLLLTVVIGLTQPRPELDVSLIGSTVLIGQEVLTGVALGLVARLIYAALRQGILMGTQQMGLADAGIINPDLGESDRPISMLFQMIFAVLFLSLNGHHLLIMALGRSYEAFPIGQAPDVGFLAERILTASAVMLTWALKLAAPLLAGFLLLAVVLGVIARVMPEMNILMASMPLRVALGMGMSLLVLRTLGSLAEELADWMNQLMDFA